MPSDQRRKALSLPRAGNQGCRGLIRQTISAPDYFAPGYFGTGGLAVEFVPHEATALGLSVEISVGKTGRSFWKAMVT